MSLQLTEEQIDEILTRFIDAYLQRVGDIGRDALLYVTDRLTKFFAENGYDDFKSAEDFADKLLDDLGRAWSDGWGSSQTRRTIAEVTRSIYEFYRLRDSTVFGDASPIRRRLGGPDRVSIKFIDELDHFYFSKFADNTNKDLRRFFVKQYFENGAALFGRETPEELDEFRKAAGAKFKNLTDRQILAIVHTSTARVRNWAHIGTLAEAGFERARLVATMDDRTSELCISIDGKYIRVDVAQGAIERLSSLEPKAFADELYGSDLAKTLRQDPSAVIREYLDDDGETISDELVGMGLGFPPFHTFCRTRMEGEFVDVDFDDDDETE